ncbi:MAG: Si-specific NAD(P)(+) transhydrogenase, partial [Pirellulaceae bacterium]
IPSKALRAAISRMMDCQHNPLLREQGVTWNFSLPQLRRSAAAVIDQQVDMRRSFYDRNQVPVIQGHARFLDPHTVQVTNADGARHQLRAASFVIATGARPYHPPGIDFQHARVFDSDSILELQQTPHSITIYGAGVVGCEYASMFRNLDCKVNLVNTRARLLEFLDDEITDALSYHLRDRGVVIRHQEEYDRVELRDDALVLHLRSGKQIKSDALLWANGRTGNSDDLGLESLGITPDSRGNLVVNESFQTAVPHIYAVGDVIGFPALASAAYVQGRAAASHVLSGRCDQMARDIPTGIYTSPEISSLGKTERELTEQRVPYEVGKAQFKSLARAQITGQTVGMLKLLFHRESLEVLGIHCFGANASEIIHIGQAIFTQAAPANTLLYFINTTFNYPTMAEAYRVAALNGYNRLC